MENPILRAKANSPNLITGPLLIVIGDQEQHLDQLTIALCRCGGSQNKPFCDGTLRRNGFEGPQVEVRLPELAPVE